MNVWIIQPFEPVPTPDNKMRLLRYGILSEILIEQGHCVTRWRSTFEGISSKKYIREKDCSEVIKKNYKVIFIHSLGYKKNISFRRILDSKILAKKFKVFAEKEQKPDVILCAMPTIDFSAAATKFGKKHNIPVIIDIRDLWPDIFVRYFPQKFQKILKPFIYPFRMQLARAIKKATVVTGMTDEMVAWALKCAQKKRTLQDKAFLNAYDYQPLSLDEAQINQVFWEKLGIKKDSNHFVVCFVGSLTKSFDFTTLIKAFNDLDSRFKLVIAGTGPELAHCQQLAANNPRIIFPGWIIKPQIQTLMQICDIAIAPYATFDFELNITTKIAEYLSAGLPILTSIKGVLEKLLIEFNCGLNYEMGNVSSLMMVLKKLAEDDQLVKQLSLNAKATFEKKFDATKIYRDMAEHIISVSKNR